MTDSIPFIVVHKGNQDYLHICLKSIEKFHPVYLLGNEDNKHTVKNWVDLKSLHSSYADDFENAYVHMSTNSSEFEKICFLRYIAMYEFARENNIKEFIHCDSDMVILKDISPLFSILRSHKSACFIPQDQSKFRLTASPHFCYWKIEALEEFIKFFIHQYQIKSSVLLDKYNYHVANNIAGGICDMTLLYLYAISNHDVFNLLDVERFYLNFNVSTKEHNTKDRGNIYFKHGFKMYNSELMYRSKDGLKPVMFLHIQGKAKKFMKFAGSKHFRTFFFMISVLNILRLIKR